MNTKTEASEERVTPAWMMAARRWGDARKMRLLAGTPWGTSNGEVSEVVAAFAHGDVVKRFLLRVAFDGEKTCVTASEEPPLSACLCSVTEKVLVDHHHVVAYCCQAHGLAAPEADVSPARPTGLPSPAEPKALDGWTGEWPTEPGEYLFYGFRRGDQSTGRLRLRMVKVVVSDNGQVHRFAESEFFYPSEQFGLFKRFTPELPSEADIHRLAK